MSSIHYMLYMIIWLRVWIMHDTVRQYHILDLLARDHITLDNIHICSIFSVMVSIQHVALGSMYWKRVELMRRRDQGFSKPKRVWCIWSVEGNHVGDISTAWRNQVCFVILPNSADKYVVWTFGLHRHLLIIQYLVIFSCNHWCIDPFSQCYDTQAVH